MRNDSYVLSLRALFAQKAVVSVCGLLFGTILLATDALASTWRGSASPLRLPDGHLMCTVQGSTPAATIEFTFIKNKQTRTPVRMIGILSSDLVNALAQAPSTADSKVQLRSGETVTMRFRKTQGGVTFMAPTVHTFYGALDLFRQDGIVLFPVGSTSVSMAGYGAQDMKALLEKCVMAM